MMMACIEKKGHAEAHVHMWISMRAACELDTEAHAHLRE